MCTRACSKKSRGSRTMSYIASGLRDSNRWSRLVLPVHFQKPLWYLIAFAAKSSSGWRTTCPGLSELFTRDRELVLFSTSAPSDSPKITVTPWTPPPCSSLAVLQDISRCCAVGWEHYRICPGCCGPRSILLGCSTAYILCQLPSLS